MALLARSHWTEVRQVTQTEPNVTPWGCRVAMRPTVHELSAAVTKDPHGPVRPAALRSQGGKPQDGSSALSTHDTKLRVRRETLGCRLNEAGLEPSAQPPPDELTTINQWYPEIFGRVPPDAFDGWFVLSLVGAAGLNSRNASGFLPRVSDRALLSHQGYSP